MLGDVLNTYCSVPGFCCFTAYLGDLYPFLQSCLFLLKGCLTAACEISTGDSNVQPGLVAAERPSVKGGQKKFS